MVRRRRRMLDDSQGEDPAAGSANLVDAMLVLAVGFLTGVGCVAGLPVRQHCGKSALQRNIKSFDHTHNNWYQTSYSRRSTWNKKA